MFGFIVFLIVKYVFVIGNYYPTIDIVEFAVINIEQFKYFCNVNKKYLLRLCSCKIYNIIFRCTENNFHLV